MFRYVILKIEMVLCVAFFSAFGEKIDLEVFASKFDSIPIAVIDFRPLNGIPVTQDMPWTVIADDLEFSGRFHVVRASRPDKSLFESQGIGLFIDGEYSVNGNEIVLDCFIHDAITGEELAGKKFRGERRFIRSMAHKYSNQVKEMFYGEKGPFESRIVFVEDKSNQKNLVVMDYDGHNQKKMTSGGVNIFPAFVDSVSIIWTAYYRGKPDLYKGSIATGKYAVFVFSRFVQASPSVSNVAGKVAYSSSANGNLDIYVCGTDALDKKQITFHRAIDTSPCWSPTGGQIAFTSDRSGQPQIYVMDADGQNIRRITSVGKYQDSPAWSPRGDKIAYSSMQNDKFDIWLVNTDGTQAIRVTSNLGNNENPSWSPDGAHIVFCSSRRGRSDLFTVRPDGTGLKQLTSNGNSKMPDWSTF